MKHKNDTSTQESDEQPAALALSASPGSLLATFESDGDSWRLLGDECWSKRPVIARHHASDYKGQRLLLILENDEMMDARKD